MVGIQKTTESILATANHLTIDSEDRYAEGAFLIKAIDFCQKTLDEELDPVRDKAYKAYKAVLDMKNQHLDPLTQARNILNTAMSSWRSKERSRLEEEARKRQDKIRQIAEENKISEAKMAEDAGDKKLAEEIINESIEMPMVEVQKVQEVDGTHVRRTWRFKIAKPELVKNEFKVPDEKAIGALVRRMGKAAEGIVGGIEVYATEILVVKGE